MEDTNSGNNIVNGLGRFDMKRLPSLSNSKIEKVISKGNNAAVRAWCLELEFSERQQYFINICINDMSNNKEKINSLGELVNRNMISSQ